MKKSALLFCLFTVSLLSAQTPVKRYVLLEHFTNSVCSTCKAKNPAFYSLVDQYSADVHHIAYHPPIPYNSCIFYQHNKMENTDRTSHYNVFGTPQVALNGTVAPVGSQLLPPATLQAQLGQTSPVLVRVQESTSGNQRTASISVTTKGAVPAGTYALYAAVVEKKVDYTSPIGSTVHRDVFRKMLPNLSGAPYTPAALGQEVNFNYTFTLDPVWVADSIYVVAFVQNTATDEVLNSGTQFDPIILGAGEATPQAVQFQPNPATAEAWAALPGQQAERVELFSIGGRLVRSVPETQNDLIRIPLENLPAGIYLVKITGKDGLFVGKLVKE